MNTLKKLWNGFLNIFGLKKNSKYVRNYLNEANMKSAIFMSFVVIVLEGWLVIRQTQKYIIPSVQALGNTANFQNVFQIIFQNTSNFFLLMFFGVAMFVYSLQYISKKQTLGKLIIPIVFAGLSLIICCLLPLEFKYNSIKFTNEVNTIKGILKIIFYFSVFAFDVGIVFASIYRYRGGKNAALGSVLIISLFAFVCLMFGVMVSYGDFVSIKAVKDASGNIMTITDKDGTVSYAYENKEIICFLMFTIYIGCLLIWNPLISIGVLGTLFLGFFLAIDHVVDLSGGGRTFPEGDQVNYLTFFISLTMVCISIYNQRISEAKKDEELEELATKDKLTGLYAFEYFTIRCKERIQRRDLSKGQAAYLFINIVGFKIYNDQKGFDKGNEFLKEVGKALVDVFNSEYISRQSDDHFVVFTKNLNLDGRINALNDRVEAMDPDIKPSIKVGVYIITSSDEDPHFCVEKARYAYSEIKHSNQNHRLSYYDDKMHDNYLMNQYVVTHIDEAIEKGYLKAYYQPVVWSKGRTLCGAEALARWIDPKFGFLSPAKFVPALENAQLIYKLDKAILRIVCKDLRHNLDNNLPALPVSINFSRADFGLIDVVDVVTETVEEFKIPHELLHIEITESALMDDESLLQSTIKRLHDTGFATWLDDFGSGYSSFNVLKDYDFDVLKLDMAFLSGFNGNEKAKSLIKSVISMADQIGMKTLCEGVETMEQAEFLESASCGRLQGYLYGKPLTYEEIMEKIASGYYNVSKEIY